MNENEKMQADAVAAVENEILQAGMLPKENTSVTDILRKNWEKYIYQTTAGSWAVKLLLTVCVFVSLFVSVRYGLSDSQSLVTDVVRCLGNYVEDTRVAVLGLEILLSLLWLGSPMLGTLLAAPLLFLCFAGFAPLPLMLAFTVLILFLFEDRSVLALLIALPPLVLLTPVHIGLFVILLAGFISVRLNSGLVKSLGFVYLALIDLAGGFFGTVSDSSGKQLIPALRLKVRMAKRLQFYFDQLQSEDAADGIFVKLLIFLSVFFVIGLVFSKLLNLRYATNTRKWFKSIPIDIKDIGILFIMATLLCAAPYVIFRLTVIKAYPYSILSVLLQAVTVYLVTRPIAGKTPKRGETVMHGDKDYIFISYAHADLERVTPYLTMLRKSGYEFWYDDSIKTGTEWQGVIASNLQNCSCFLAFISANSITSEYCLKEINYATSKNKPMAVIMLDDVLLPPVLEMHLASLQAVKRDKFDSDADCMQKVFEMEQLLNCKYN